MARQASVSPNWRQASSMTQRRARRKRLIDASLGQPGDTGRGLQRHRVIVGGGRPGGPEAAVGEGGLEAVEGAGLGGAEVAEVAGQVCRLAAGRTRVASTEAGTSAAMEVTARIWAGEG